MADDARVVCEGDHIVWDVCGDRPVLVEARGNWYADAQQPPAATVTAPQQGQTWQHMGSCTPTHRQTMGHCRAARKRQRHTGAQVRRSVSFLSHITLPVNRQLEQEWDQVDDTTTTKADRIYVGEDNQALSTEVCVHTIENPLFSP